MEYLLGFIIFSLTAFIFHSASKNSYRSRMMDDLDRNSSLAQQALEKGDWEVHAKHKMRMQEIYTMLRNCDSIDGNTHWRL